MTDGPVIEAVGLRKQYGDFVAVSHVDLAVERGQILGVLGPNGAGKSTTVRMLTTMTTPNGGTARVAGLDVVADSRAVRRIIGVTGQDATLDEMLTGAQNLVLVGELSGLARRAAKARAVELLDRFELTDAGGRMVKTYSGGMRRRLDLAASLVGRPPVLFLDEPTTDSIPRAGCACGTSSASWWPTARRCCSRPSTSTRPMSWPTRSSVIDKGTVIAEGTARELKSRIGGERLEVTLTQAHAKAVGALVPLVAGEVQVSDFGRRLSAPVVTASGMATAVIRALDDAGVGVDDIEVHRPSLDDVFFALTGRPSADEHAADDGDAPDGDVAAPTFDPDLQEVPA